MAEVLKITEELDRIQKRAASLREIYKLYPDTIVRRNYKTYGDETFNSKVVNKEVNIVRFDYAKHWLSAYTSKIIGCIEVHSDPSTFVLLQYYPEDMYTQLIVQNYQDAMRANNIPEEIIRTTDLRVLEFIRDRTINLSKSNLKDINPDTTIAKLLVLL
jgi:hypothetical protein